MGDLKTSGIDVSLNYATPMTATGRYSFGIDGTYVIKYDYQNEKDGEWIHNVGSYEGTGPIIRWKHVANLNWNYEDWALRTSNNSSLAVMTIRMHQTKTIKSATTHSTTFQAHTKALRT